MRCNFDEIPDRVHSDSAKWKHYEPDVLPMWVADMDFRSPEPVINALRQRVDHGIFGYPCELPEMQESVVSWLKKRHNWKVAPESLMFIPGVITGFNLVSHAVSQPGDAVLIQTPAYPPFFRVSKNVGLIQQENDLIKKQNGEYEIDFDAFESVITDRTSIFILCNPHNPTGRVFHKDELEKMAEICLRHNVLICSDEIHHDLIYSESKHIPIASIDREVQQKTVTLFAPSKTFNIAGLCSSVAVVPNEDLRQKLEAAKQGLLGWVNLMGRVATLAAYQHGEEWLDELMVYLEGNRDFTYQFVNDKIPGVSMGKPEGTYLAWLDCSEAGLDMPPADFFLEKARVGLNAGEYFGEKSKDFVRLNFGSPRSALEEGLERMRKALLSN
jgi:cystathionine beta-lyase